MNCEADEIFDAEINTWLVVIAFILGIFFVIRFL